jgi:dihydrofolate reductase
MPRIEGYAIISRNGMIANADGSFPSALRIDADQRFFRAAVRRADAIAHGRNSGPEESSRKRVVLTRRIASLDKHPASVSTILWNPAGAAFADACERLQMGPADAMAVLGGTDVFGLFLGIGYHAFFLSCTEVDLPGGRPVFPGADRPQEVLSRHGLALHARQSLDTEGQVVLETWRRG